MSARTRGQEGQHGREDRTQVPRQRLAPEPGRPGRTPVSHPARPVRRGLGSGGRAARRRPRAASQDPVRLGQGRAPRAVHRLPPADVRTPGPRVAGRPRAEPGCEVRPGPPGRRPGRVRLHVHERAGHHHPGPAVRPPRVPLRPHALELGGRLGLCVRVVRGPGRRVAGRTIRARRGAPAAPQGQPDGGRQQPVRGAGVPRPIPGSLGPLRAGRRADQRPPAARERGRRVVPRALQDGRRSGPPAPGPPGLRHPGRVRGLLEECGGDTERRPGDPGRRGPGGPPAAPAEPIGHGPAGPVPGRLGQPDPRPPEHGRGPQPADRPRGRRPRTRRPMGRVRRRPARGHPAPAGRQGPAPGELPARDRLPGPQARGVRRVRVPRGPVPDDPVPDRVRPAVRGARAGGRDQGVPAGVAARGRGRRGRDRRRLAGPARP